MVLLFISLIGIVSFSFSPAFAKHIDPAGEVLPTYEGYEPLRFYTIYASYYRECNSFDQDKILFYEMLSHQYLRDVGFLPIASGGDCVKVTGLYEQTSGDPTQGLTLDDAIKKAEDWHFDLLVIVLDTPLSYESYLRSILERGGTVFGHYWPGEDEETRYIVTSTPLEAIEGQEGAWVLSHELAHFAYHQLDYPPNVWGGDKQFWKGAPKSYVHQTQDKYNKCLANQFSFDYCSDIYSTIKGYSGNFKVLAPYDGTISKTNIIWTGPNPPVSKNWKYFGEGDTVHFTGQLTSERSDGVKDIVKGAKIKIVDMYKYETSSKEYIPVLGTGFTDQFGNYDITWKAIKHTGMDFEGGSYWTPVAKFSGDDVLRSTLTEGRQFQVLDKPIFVEPKQTVKSKVPTFLTLNNPPQGIVEGDIVQLTGKLGYVRGDGSIGSLSGVKVGMIDTTLIDNGGYRWMGQATTNANGNFVISWEAIKNPSLFTSGGSWWQSKVYFNSIGDYETSSLIGKQFFVKDKPAFVKPEIFVPEPTIPEPTIQEPTITYHNTFLTLETKVGSDDGIIEFIPILKYSSGKELATNNVKLKVGDVEYQVLANEWSELRVDSVGYHKLTASFDGDSIHDGKIVYRSSSDTTTAYVGTIAKPYQDNKPYVDYRYELRNEIQEITSDLEGGIDNAEKALTGLVFQKKEAQQKIDRAWDLSKETQKRVDALHSYYLKNMDISIEKNIGAWQYDGAKSSAGKAGANLVEISQLIEEAKQLESQKFCFLWWCW